MVYEGKEKGVKLMELKSRGQEERRLKEGETGGEEKWGRRERERKWWAV